MKLNEITEIGFYYQPEDTDRTYIYEVIESSSTDIDPEDKFFVVEYFLDYIDNGMHHYKREDKFLPTTCYENSVEVMKFIPNYYKVEGNCGEYLVEDKPTYKEKLKKIKKVCDKASTITQFVGGVEVKDAQKLALKILKILGD